MNIFIIIMGFLFGAILGSFLNVVALRFNTGKSLGGRSGCFSCGHQLSWYELIPVFSWLFQRGRCRSCSSKISKQYLFAELLTGTFFALITARFVFISSFNWFSVDYLIGSLFLFIVVSILVVIFIYDMRHKIIPDELSFAFGLLGLVGMFFFGFENGLFTFQQFSVPPLVDMFAGILVPLPFVLLWIISQGRWIGLGDPKLMVGMGFLLGIQRGVTAVFMSFWIGSLVVISMILLEKIFGKGLLSHTKKSIMKEEVPFGPFLIIGFLVTLVVNINLFQL